MDITFKGRHTSVPERFRRHASAKLTRLEKLDHDVMRVDVEISTERNPRQADHSERVELTVRSRGPAIRAEAAADDRYAALDLAYAKLEGRLRKASERRKPRHGDLSTVRSADVLAAVAAAPAEASVLAADAPTLADVAIPAIPAPDDAAMLSGTRVGRKAISRAGGKANGRANGHRRPETTIPRPALAADEDFGGLSEEMISGLLPIQMEGDGPLVVREKFHASHPMTIDQALLEMELVGHDFFAYHDSECGSFSVIYRRCGYDYGVIRLVDDYAGH